LQDSAEDSPPGTEMLSKICPTAEHKQEMRRGRSKEVVKKYEKRIQGKSGTT